MTKATSHHAAPITSSALRSPDPVEPHNQPRLLLTVPEAAYRLGIGRSLLYELIADGRVESIQVGRLRRIPADAVATFVASQRRLPVRTPSVSRAAHQS